MAGAAAGSVPCQCKVLPLRTPLRHVPEGLALVRSRQLACVVSDEFDLEVQDVAGGVGLDQISCSLKSPEKHKGR